MTRNTATNEVVEEKEVKKKCWMYTWKGPETENSNKTGSSVGRASFKGPSQVQVC